MVTKVDLLQKAIDDALDELRANGPTSSFVAGERLVGSSWELIAKKIYSLTEIDVTGETLRKWFGNDQP